MPHYGKFNVKTNSEIVCDQRRLKTKEEKHMFQSNLMTGKRILITGGGTGLGRSMAEKVLELGGEVVICGRRKQILDEAAAEMRKLSPLERESAVQTYGLDIRDASAVDAMIEDIFAHGGLTGLVNNAAGNFISPTDALSTRGFDAIANIVFHGTFYITQGVGKRWVDAAKRQGGWTPGSPMKSVISIVTTWVDNGGPFVVPSAMSKAGIAIMTKSLATEWGRFGVRLNAIGPGEIPTEGMSKRLNPGEEPGARSKKNNPQGRPGDMSELQNLATFLLADGCDWLSGQIIHMDGASALGTGGNFYALRDWSDEQWGEARQRIETQNAKDRAQRS
jgi:NAD(P)-dependent dehydrogenase (short-subunit alcohol dehydrogenase family)